jgi:hypothetical protein
MWDANAKGPGIGVRAERRCERMYLMSTSNGAQHGPELYNEMQRLICEWYGSDADERMAGLPKLVRDLAALQQSHAARVTPGMACHDCVEAA